MMTNIEIDLEFGLYNGSMSADVYVNDALLTRFADVTKPIQQISIDVNLPCKIRFELDGKNNNIDTKVDDQGRIIADKYVKVTAIRLGKILLSPLVMCLACNYSRHSFDATVTETFWGFNGNVVIDFDEADFIRWHLKNNNTFEI